MRPAFPVPTVTYHHLPTTSVQASIATVPQPTRQPIILRRGKITSCCDFTKFLSFKKFREIAL